MTVEVGAVVIVRLPLAAPSPLSTSRRPEPPAPVTTAGTSSPPLRTAVLLITVPAGAGGAGALPPPPPPPQPAWETAAKKRTRKKSNLSLRVIVFLSLHTRYFGHAPSEEAPGDKRYSISTPVAVRCGGVPGTNVPVALTTDRFFVICAKNWASGTTWPPIPTSVAPAASTTIPRMVTVCADRLTSS